MNESDKVFYGNLCFVCHATANEVKLRKCGSCKMISYCCEEHQKVHWKRHRSLCKVVRKVFSVLPVEDVKTHREWFEHRTRFLVLCELLIKRKLKPCETNMILFPSNCQVCHRTNNLIACQNCLCVNYCSENHEKTDLPFHNSFCHSFALCLEIDLYLENNPLYPDYCFREGSLTLTDAMTTFIETNILLGNNNAVALMVEKALVSELITCPLSLLYASHLMNYRLTENVLLHVVGCSYLETGSLKSWELILHLHPQIDRLEIHFIGPEVQEVYKADSCEACRGKLKFKFFEGFYHDYLKSTHHLEEPTLICTFNCGYHEFENLEADTWKETLPFLVGNPNVPLIFTSFTEDESEVDGKRLLAVNDMLNLKIRKNEFRSLRPYRDLEKMGVYFSNNYVGTVFHDSG